MTPRASARKEKTGKLYFIKIKNCGASKNTIKKVKKISYDIDWEEVFASCIYDKDFISRIHKELL